MRRCPRSSPDSRVSASIPLLTLRPNTQRDNSPGPRYRLWMQKMRDRFQHVHWLVLASMVGSLVVGILFAVGHHVSYNSRDGTTPPLLVYSLAGSQISEHALNLTIGTTFTLFVRSCLAFAMSLLYIQLAWYTVMRRAHDYTILDIDGLTSPPGNMLVVWGVFAWIKWPSLLLVALLSCYDPPNLGLRLSSDWLTCFCRSQWS